MKLRRGRWMSRAGGCTEYRLPLADASTYRVIHMFPLHRDPMAVAIRAAAISLPVALRWLQLK